jgi:hypothetical protein
VELRSGDAGRGVCGGAAGGLWPVGGWLGFGRGGEDFISSNARIWAIRS